jgi:peptidoglycan hydrolase-like protein with peptidoglycan-binding domain
VPKKFKAEVSDIKSRVDTLETRVEGVETKTADMERASSEQARALEDMKSKPVDTNFGAKRQSVGKSKERIRDIQTCLKNAGFYSGKIDGVKGRQTRRAIKEFQSANGLKADGIVGPKTWNALSNYMSGAGPAASGTEEGASTK